MNEQRLENAELSLEEIKINATMSEISAYDAFVDEILNADWEEKTNQMEAELRREKSLIVENGEKVVEGKLAVAVVEAEAEAKWDELFEIEREYEEMEAKMFELQQQQTQYNSQRNVCEMEIKASLKKRENMLNDSFLLQQRIEQLENPSRSSYWMRKKELFSPRRSKMHKEKRQRLEQKLALTKLAIAELKSQLDSQHNSYRQLEKQYVELKSDLAASQASVDDARITMEHALREKALVQEKLMNITNQLANLET